MKRLRLALAAATVLACVAGTASAEGLRKITFAFNYRPADFYIAHWVAQEKGYYAREGLEVDFQYSKGSGDSIAKVDTGQAALGIADAMVLAAARARGAKVKVVGMIYDKGPLNIFLRSDGPVKTPKDLEGRTLGAPAGDAQRQLFPAFAKVAGIDPEKVSWLTLDVAAKVPALAASRVDGVAEYITNLPAFEKALGADKVRTMRWSDFGFDLYSNGFIAPDATIEKDPELIRKFLTATYQGWVDVYKDVEGGLAIYKKAVPEMDIDLTRDGLKRITLGMIRTPFTEKAGIGAIDRAKMCQTVTMVNDNMGLPRQVTCDEVFDAKFIPHVEFPK